MSRERERPPHDGHDRPGDADARGLSGFHGHGNLDAARVMDLDPLLDCEPVLRGQLAVEGEVPAARACRAPRCGVLRDAMEREEPASVQVRVPLRVEREHVCARLAVDAGEDLRKRVRVRVHLPPDVEGPYGDLEGVRPGRRDPGREPRRSDVPRPDSEGLRARGHVRDALPAPRRPPPFPSPSPPRGSLWVIPPRSTTPPREWSSSGSTPIPTSWWAVVTPSPSETIPSMAATYAVPREGWPANGISPPGGKIRFR